MSPTLIYTVTFLSGHLAAESDDATQNILIGDNQSCYATGRLTDKSIVDVFWPRLSI